MLLLGAATALSLLSTCQDEVSPSILNRLMTIESSKRQFAIAVVGVDTVSQPTNKQDAVNVIKDLESKGFNYSVGYMQINKHNFEKYGLTLDTAFDACANIETGAKIYAACFNRAKKKSPKKPHGELLNDAASCYYSGNFIRGYKGEGKKNISYVDKFQSVEKLDYIKEDYSDRKLVSEQTVTDSNESEKTPATWDVFGDF